MKDKAISRRQFVENSGKAGAAIALAGTIIPALTAPAAAGAAPFVPNTSYTQDPLPYGFKDLEPYIDAQTMELHYTKHAAGYAKNLAEAAAAEGVNTANTPLEKVLANVSKYSVKMRNNGGGHYNHELFWKVMKPKDGSKPDSKLDAAITKSFGSFDAFTTQFSDAAKNRFGSGWAWLVLTNDKQLKIGSTPNQDNPLMDISDIKGLPLLGLDVWEHAYYLHYQNRRPEYITNWWNIVNWQFVSDRYATALK